jgi:uncharacterized protein
VSLLEAVAIVAAGFAAGVINTVVGSGSLITFPTLVALGYPPVVANVSNSVGLVPGSMAGAWGYRRELVGQRNRLLQLGAVALVGAVVGALLLLKLPPEAFETIVPVLIVLACVLVAIQPWLTQKLKHRPRRENGGFWVWLMVLGSSIYGGYFGAAQGVILIAVLGLGLAETLQRVNAAKNVLAGLVNLVAGIVFIAIADVDWAVVAMIAIGAATGGVVGARIARSLAPVALRIVVIAVGIVATISFIVNG